ncbi:ATP-dependent RNA helicase DHX58 [Cyrtonyx montezumae]|uniref:ATP-dependent RNA helicase DHX58 n=1 Tax=Cyrtonyx montezumae TaxID=9017 RepID=UPI0032DA2FCF
MELRGYQLEAVGPALRGRNSIVWLPTGAGKTRAAVHVCRRHLEGRRGGRAAVLVNKVHLVQQHLEKEFHVLSDAFKVTAVSGDSSHKCFFGPLAKGSDVVICTAQILQNALLSEEEEERVELTDFSLLVIDECHHTHKEAVYNKIMLSYLKKKLSGQRDLPQILGLTASLGTGGQTSLEGAVEHILEICANLDTEVITSAQEHAQHLQSHVPQPRRRYDLSQERAQDPFGQRLKEIMAQIQEHMEVPGLPRDFGTQGYEQRIVELENRAAEMFCRKTRVCALHLRKYNDALLINDAVRTTDAFQCLQQFYAGERDTKDPTERFLATVFEENRAALLMVARDQRYENPRLSKLEEILQEHFQPLGSSRGIVFTKTRQSAHSLLSWLQGTAALRGQHIRAAALTGARYSNQTKGMTQNEQQDVITQFRNGELNLLFSTSVAEEGLDIPECNIVVRYGLMTSEIAMVQARGRARAQNSVYSVLAKANSQEVLREQLNENLVELMERAIRAVQAMPEREYHLKIMELQRSAVLSWQLKEARSSEGRQLHDPDDVYFHCVNCGVAVCRGSDIRTVEAMHHVNINPSFRIYYTLSSEKLHFERTFRDWEPGCCIACSECGQKWGIEMIYQNVKLPILSIKNFVVVTPDERRKYKKWSRVTFPIKAFSYVEYCSSIQDESL